MSASNLPGTSGMPRRSARDAAASRARRRRALAGLGVLAALGATNLLLERVLPAARLDLTADRSWSLPDGSRALLRALPSPVRLRVQYSPALGSLSPPFGFLADQLRDTLQRYAEASGGRLRVEWVDPDASGAGPSAAPPGLQPVPLADNAGEGFLGIEGQGAEGRGATLPLLRPETRRRLDYDLLRLLRDLSGQPRPVLGVLSSLPLEGDPAGPLPTGPDQAFTILGLLGREFTLLHLDGDLEAIDPSVDVLLVAQAQHLPRATLLAIDQFALGGRPVLALVDPQSEYQASRPGPDNRPATDTASDLPALLRAWGVGFDPGLVVGDLDSPWRVRAAPGDPAGATDYVPWFNVSAGLSRADPATAPLRLVSVASPGSLSPLEGATTRFEPFLRSGPLSGLLPRAAIAGDPDPGQLLAAFRPAGGARVLGARVSGPSASAFAADAATPFAPRLSSGRTLRVAVLADSDLLDDRFSEREQDVFGHPEPQDFDDNQALVANLLSTLATGRPIPGLRAVSAASPLARLEREDALADAALARDEAAVLDRLRPPAPAVSTDPQTGLPVDAAPSPRLDEAASARDRLALARLVLRSGRERQARRDRLMLLDILAAPACVALAAAIGLLRRRRP